MQLGCREQALTKNRHLDRRLSCKPTNLVEQYVSEVHRSRIKLEAAVVLAVPKIDREEGGVVGRVLCGVELQRQGEAARSNNACTCYNTCQRCACVRERRNLGMNASISSCAPAVGPMTSTALWGSESTRYYERTPSPPSLTRMPTLCGCSPRPESGADVRLLLLVLLVLPVLLPGTTNK